MTVLTLGHSRRSLQELVEVVRAAGITLLVDVRRYPMSRRNPQFNRDVIEIAFYEAGVRYVHEPGLGGRRAPVEGSVNTYWKNEQFRGFADHMATDEFAEALSALLDSTRTDVVAIMCAETVPWRCHRRLIADRLVALGHEVVHVLDIDRSEPHQLSAAAHIGAEGMVTYPGPPHDD